MRAGSTYIREGLRQAGRGLIVVALAGAVALLFDLETSRPARRGADAALLLAVQGRDHDGVRAALADGASTEPTSQDGRTPLLWAIADDDRSTVELLLNHGADSCHMTPTGLTPLAAAACHGDTLLVERLLAAGAEPNPDHGRPAPLAAAASSGNADTVRMLLRAGADVNATARGRQSALHVAAENVNVSQDVIDLLLASGCDPTLRDEDGATPADLARAAGRDAIARRIESACPDHELR
ncbi:MAG: ankyrin repeat domain-containing protein [Tepidisphaeraceae bacterium]